MVAAHHREDYRPRRGRPDARLLETRPSARPLRARVHRRRV